MAVSKNSKRLAIQPVPTEEMTKDIPVAVDFTAPTGIFSLGLLGTVTPAMVNIEDHPKGFKLTSKHPLEKGYIIVAWAGVRKVRYMTQEDYDERTSSQAQ